MENCRNLITRILLLNKRVIWWQWHWERVKV